MSHTTRPPVPLSHFLDLVHQHGSLQQARIASAEAHLVMNGRVPHRFIILRLERNGYEPIWLRMDRLRSRERGAFRFIAAGATTLANDQVCFFGPRYEYVLTAMVRSNSQQIRAPCAKVAR